MRLLRAIGLNWSGSLIEHPITRACHRLMLTVRDQHMATLRANSVNAWWLRQCRHRLNEAIDEALSEIRGALS